MRLMLVSVTCLAAPALGQTSVTISHDHPTGQVLPGDVVGLMCHAQRQEAYDWIAEHGGTPDSPDTLAAKVRAASA